MKVKIAESWLRQLHEEFDQEYFQKITEKVKQDISSGIEVYPNGKDIFRAFELCSFEDTKVVLLGQDPYHGPGQAHGLCFSVPEGIRTPPSLVNIYKELHTDIGCIIPNHGNLSKWAAQGVLMLNTSLTVQAQQAGSHSKIGWERFTDSVIKKVSAGKENVVFILWGGHARSKAGLIDATKHLVLQSAHPSPLSAHNGFWGNKHFSTCNNYLVAHGKTPVDWQV
ncbi:MAG: uracil-DNA glycosylase [Bacteroidetes bacterium 43-16]|nr:MAG: uracil-DNA glycosylase [Bacteroidetes bacterium 43-16]